MSRFFRSGAGALVLHLVCSILLAAAVSPWIHRAGKSLAAAHPVSEEEASNPIEWLAAAAGRSDFDRFFDRSLLLCALLLIPFLIHRLRRLPGSDADHPSLTPLLPKSRRLVHLTFGLVLAGGLLWGLGEVLQMFGGFETKESRGFSRWASKALMPTFFASVIEEWLFRGLILGLWLRALPTGKAIVACSLLFAAVHFLKPPESWTATDGNSPTAGFELLGAVVGQWLNPSFFIREFLALFLIGLILAVARVRTRSLWLPIGLHAGWILAFKSFNLFHRRVPMEEFPAIWVGEDLRSGVAPILTLCLTAALLTLFLRRQPAA